MRRIPRCLGITMTVALLVILFSVTAMPVPIGAGAQIEVLRVYDAAAGEWPEGVAADKKGNLYVSFMPLGQIRKITADGTDPVVVQFPERDCSKQPGSCRQRQRWPAWV